MLFDPMRQHDGELVVWVNLNLMRRMVSIILELLLEFGRMYVGCKVLEWSVVLE